MPSSPTASFDRAKLLWTLVVVLAIGAVVAAFVMLRSDNQPAAITSPSSATSSLPPSPTATPTEERPPLIVTSRVTSQFNKKDLSYSGRVISEEPKCTAGRTLFLKERRKGSDAIVYSTRTDVNGRWATPPLRALRSGSGVAQAQRRVVLRDDGRTVVCQVSTAIH